MKSKKTKSRSVFSRLLPAPQLAITEELLQRFVGGQVLIRHAGSASLRGCIENIAFSSGESGKGAVTMILAWLEEDKGNISGKNVWEKIREHYELPVDIATVLNSTKTEFVLLTSLGEKVHFFRSDHPKCIKVSLPEIRPDEHTP